MKFNVLFILLYGCLFENQISSQFSESSESGENEKLKCKICYEMFPEFDFDKLTNDANKIKMIKNLENSDERIILIAKEISMQYFFKGAEAQFENKDEINECNQNNTQCGKVINEVCEQILNLKKNTCSLNKINNFLKPENENETKNPMNYSFMDLKTQITPSYIQENFNSEPKSHWTPLKPVLLQNFERSIGDQLKDISSLAR